jgi:hypothetical protein
MSGYRRPVYENAESLAEERRFASAIEERWNCRLRKQPRHFILDFAVERDGVIVGFAEIKCRNYRSDAFRDYMISLSKIARAREIKRVTGLDTALCVRFTNADLMRKITDDRTVSVGMGGRKDRGDPEDIETVAMIPLREFKFIERREV